MYDVSWKSKWTRLGRDTGCERRSRVRMEGQSTAELEIVVGGIAGRLLTGFVSGIAT